MEDGTRLWETQVTGNRVSFVKLLSGSVLVQDSSGELLELSAQVVEGHELSDAERMLYSIA